MSHTGQLSRFEYDYFISYTQSDHHWATWISWQIEKLGHTVLVQARDMPAGSSWVNAMHEGTQQAQKTIALLSSAYALSDYGTAEWQSAWRNDPLGKLGKLLVVRLEDCERPGLLGNLVSIDIFGHSRSQVRQILANEIGIAKSSHPTLTSEPPFPGVSDIESAQPDSVGAIRNVPLRNPNFVGRESDLSALRMGFSTENTTMVIETMSGLGGIGKTQTVIEYAHRYSNEYGLIWWIDAQHPNLLEEQIAALDQPLGLPIHPDLEARLAGVRSELRRRDDWLLIFDNAEEVNSLRPFLPEGFGHVLITTRRAGFRDLGQVHQLDIPKRGDAIRLLRQRAPTLATIDADRISEELGDLPLALAQAAAYLDETGTPANTYLNLLRSHAADMHLRGHAGDYPHTIATVWKLSLDSITNVSPACLELLRLCAWMAPENIPLELFEKHPGLLPEPLATSARDQLALNDAVGALTSYSLVRRTDDGLIMHRMVQAVVRNTIEEPDRHYYTACVVALLRNHLPSQLDILDRPPQGRSPSWVKYLSHVLALIEHSRQSVATDREAIAWLIFHAGLNMAGVDSDEAARLLEESHCRYLELYGPVNATVVAALAELGMHLTDRERWTAARPVLEHALRSQELLQGSSDRRTASILTYYGATLRGLGNPEEARLILERALRIQIAEQGEGGEDPEAATTLAPLALTLRDLGDPQSARPLLERAVAIRQSVYGRRHPWTATHMHHLGVVLADLGEFDAAKRTLEEALSIRHSTYGPRSGIVAMSMQELARVLDELGKFTAAKTLLVKSLKIREQRHGKDHPKAVECRNLLDSVEGKLT